MGLFDEIKKRIGKGTGSEDAAPPREQGSGKERPAAPQSFTPEEPPSIPEVTPEELYAQIQAGEPVVLLDVRMAWDHALQRPAGSVSLPLNDLPARLEELDRSQHYVLSCYHGYSSLNGVAFLMEQGFERVESLQGGFSGWAGAGLPVES